MWLSWDLGALLAAGLAAVAFAVRRGSGAGWAWVAAFAGEASLVAGLYSVWQLIGALPTRTVQAASAHGLWIWHVEQWLHLPSERSIQRAVLSHPLLVQASNGFYAVVHISALGLFLVWLFLAHRDRYPFYRNVLGMLTLVCLVSHLYPVAPPRLLPGLGFVDSALKYHQSVYGAVGATGISDQVSAMPSVHVAWAALIAVAVIAVSGSRWRWLVVLHPVLTTLVIVVTANHFWLDGVAAVALLGLCLLAVRAADRIAPERSDDRHWVGAQASG